MWLHKSHSSNGIHLKKDKVNDGREGPGKALDKCDLMLYNKPVTGSGYSPEKQLNAPDHPRSFLYLGLVTPVGSGAVMGVNMEPCTKCGAKNRNKRAECRPCKNLRARNWRCANIEKVYSSKNEQRLGSEAVKVYHQSEGPIAHRIIREAIASGALIRPNKCERCKKPNPSGASIHAHHADYSKPLSVEFLCSLCHGAEHTMKDLQEARRI